MNLIDENLEKEESESKKKTIKLIIISIAVLIVLAIFIVVVSTIKSNNKVKLYIDDESIDVSNNSGLFLMQDEKNLYEENGQVYISVKKLASILKVEYYNDEYKNNGEDTTKCNIKNQNEYTSYISNSPHMYKAIVTEEPLEDPNNNNKDQKTKKVIEYEDFTVENGVKYENGEIYANQDAIFLGFNVSISYDKKKKTISMRTLNGLEIIASNIAKNVAVVGDDVDYTNKKLLKYGLIMVRNANDCYGIANYYDYQEGNYLVSCKYSKLKFCESTKTVIVTTAEDEKVGILELDIDNNNARVIVSPIYQSVKLLQNDGTKYVVEENNKYGIIDVEGGTVTEILKAEYQAIGLENADLEYMDNKYVINDKYIPVKLDNKWGLINLEGKTLVSPRYEEIACNLGELGSGNPVILLPNLYYGDDGVVFCANKENPEYVIIDVKTTEKINTIPLSEIYSKYVNNEISYFAKIVSGDSSIKINVYDIFGKKVIESNKIDDIDTNSVDKTKSSDTENSTTNNTDSDSSINNTENN